MTAAQLEAARLAGLKLGMQTPERPDGRPTVFVLLGPTHDGGWWFKDVTDEEIAERRARC